MSSSIVEAILLSSGIGYGGVSDFATGAWSSVNFIIKSRDGYFQINLGEKSSYGVDYSIIEIKPVDACTYDACDFKIDDIDIGYVVFSESSYIPNGIRVISEFSELTIEHSKGTIKINESEDNSGVFIINKYDI